VPLKFFHTIRLLLTFYKSFFLANLLITGACMVLFWEYGLSIFKVLFWFKLVTLWMVFQFIRAYKSKEFYYYQNLGVSKFVLWATTLGFDFCLFLFLLIQVHKLNP